MGLNLAKFRAKTSTSHERIISQKVRQTDRVIKTEKTGGQGQHPGKIHVANSQAAPPP